MNDVLEQAKSMHRGGRLDEAVRLYLRVLEADQDSYDAHNMLGNARSDQGNWPAAIECYRRAVEIDAHRSSAHYNLGNALSTLGVPEDAAQCYRQALEHDPDFTAARFNLGNACYDLEQWDEAVDCFQRVLNADPEHPDPDAVFNLARSLHRADKVDEALTFYRQAASSDPNSYAVCNALSLALLDAKQPAEAIEWAQRVCELKPELMSAHFDVGRALMSAGRFGEAKESFRRVLELDPHNAVCYETLGLLLELAGEHEQLAALAEDWKRANPADPRADHLKAAWTGEKVPDRASDDYVRATFDQFAPDFDRTLRKLGYQAPQLLSSAVNEVCGDRGPTRDILDAGCGTGLCGPLLRPLAARLIGVDLSGQMLQEAHRGGVYDELVEAELTAYLRAAPHRFDLIVAADTLVYFGDLGPVLAAAQAALRSGGMLAFTVESLAAAGSEDVPFRLDPHGRYRHTEAYVRQTLQASGLTLCRLHEAELRQQGDKPVTGFVVLATKGAPGLL